MSSAWTLGITLTATDLAADKIRALGKHIDSLGEAGKKAAKHFDAMTSAFERSAKTAAVTQYAISKIRPAISSAATLQEALIDTKMNLMEAGKSAQDLDAQLAQVKTTAVSLQKIAPFSAEDVVNIENTLLKAGLGMSDVAGDAGAAFAATALATIEKESPVVMAESLVKIGSLFGLVGEQYGYAADRLQKASSASTASVVSLMEGLKFSGGGAARLNVDLNTTLALLSALDQKGLNGSMGGTALDEFLKRMAGITPEARKVMDSFGLKFFEGGKLKQMPDIIDQLREKLGALDDEKQTRVLNMLFGDQGGRAASALMSKGAGSFEEILAAMERIVDLQTKMDERTKGQRSSWNSLLGSMKTTGAVLFEPWLAPLTATQNLLNDIVSKIGEVAAKSPGLTKAFSGLAAGTLAVGGGYAAWQLGKAGIEGFKTLKGLGGVSGLLKSFKSTSLGIIEGKAIEAATGVTPVFVTNWPASSSRGAFQEYVDLGKGTATEAAGTAAGTAVGKMGLRAGLNAAVGSLWAPAAMALGSAGAAATAAGVGVAAGTGALVGTGINAGINWADREFKTSIGETIGEAVAKGMALLGNQEARIAIEVNEGRRAQARILQARGINVDVDAGPFPAIP